MSHSLTTLSTDEFPRLLREIPDPPDKLYLKGSLPPQKAKCLAVVGSRKYTTYGKQTVEKLIGDLRGHDVAIISGLALGIDGLAHEAALRANLCTLAVPGSGLNDDVLYPARHKRLAMRILQAGGGLLSEFEPDFEATPWSFPKRNRIMAGLAHAVLVIEAAEKSGTLITARLATDYNRDVLTVPGSIFSKSTFGPHMLIRLGAVPVTSAQDILEALGVEPKNNTEAHVPENLSVEEQSVLKALNEPHEKDTLISKLNMPVHKANILLSKMELDGLITIEMNTVQRNI